MSYNYNRFFSKCALRLSKMVLVVIVVVDHEELKRDFFGLIPIWMDLDPSNNGFYR